MTRAPSLFARYIHASQKAFSEKFPAAWIQLQLEMAGVADDSRAATQPSGDEASR